MIALISAVLALSMQDPGDGLRRYRDGDFAGAAEAFQSAVADRPESPELLYDLALAQWRAGKLSAAEDAIERYAAVPGGGRADLHHGLLGNLRYTEAEALGRQAEAPPAPPANDPTGAPPPPPDPVALLEHAVQRARDARDEFVRAAAAPSAGREVARNTERALRLLADLEKKLEEAKKQREQQQKDDQKGDDKKQDEKQDPDEKDQDKKDGDKKQDEQKQQQDEQKQDDKQQQDKDQQQQQQQDHPGDDKQQQDQQQKQDGEPKPDDKAEARPEPKPEDPSKDKRDEQAQQGDAKPPEDKDGEQRPEPKADEASPKDEQPAAGEPRSDAPGEQVLPTELSPEQKARLLEELRGLDERLRKLRAQARGGRKPVERDW